MVKIKKNGTGSINSFNSQPCYNQITIKLLDSSCDSHKELEEIKVVPLVGASTTMLAREDKKFDIQSNELKTNYHLPLFQPTHFRYFCRFFTISISILISIFHFVSISRSTSIFWISRFQDQYQYQYLGKSNFEINIKINMTNILKNIGKSIYCPIPAVHI